MTFDPEAASYRTKRQSDMTGNTGIAAKLSSADPTLGELLALEAKNIASRHMPVFPWLRLLESARERIVSRPVPSQKRFQRTEAFPVPALPIFSPPQQSFAYPDSDTLEQVVEGNSQVWGQPHSSDAQQQQQSMSILEGGAGGRTGDGARGGTQDDAGGEGAGKMEDGASGGASPPLRQGRYGNFRRQVWGDQSLSLSVQQRGRDAVGSDDQRGGGVGNVQQQKEGGQPLPLLVQQRLRDFVGPGTETIRTHSDEVADAIAHGQHADAVTIGHHVFFRRGHFQPQEHKGFALLTHEAMHVMQAMRPDSAWKRATQRGIHEDEQEANAQERKALHTGQGSSFFPQSSPLGTRRDSGLPLPAHASPPRPQTTSGPIASSSPVQRPMAAATDRTIDEEARPTSSMLDVEELKRMVYRDLIRQIRADLERGG